MKSKKRVIIIDTSNEIAGDSDVPHSGIGRARRMQVPKTEPNQNQVWAKIRIYIRCYA